jgi:hypothetical protein
MQFTVFSGAQCIECLNVKRGPLTIPQKIIVPGLLHSSSPSAHLRLHAQSHASATHGPYLPLTFQWRCCCSGCLNNNSVSTTTPFAYLRHARELKDTWYWAPSYRLDKCSECQHQACEICLMLQTEGHIERQSAEAEENFEKTGDVGI